MNWSGFLNVAKRLLADQPSSPDIRTAISRAYYAPYNTARAYQRSLGVRSRSTVESDHESVPKGFRGSTDPAGNRIARDLVQLRRWRHLADYAEHAPEVERSKTARRALQLAESILASLEYCRTNLDQDELRQEMQHMI